MDPDEALTQLRAAVERFHVAVAQDDHVDDQLGEAHQVVELFEGLDEWLTRKGFLPRPWAARTDPPRVQDVERWAKDQAIAAALVRDDDYTPEAIDRTADEEEPSQTSELVVALTVTDQKRALHWLVENGRQAGIVGVDDDYAVDDDEEDEAEHCMQCGHERDDLETVDGSLRLCGECIAYNVSRSS